MFYGYKKMLVPDHPIVRPQTKTVPYTIIPIGGPEDLKAWRKDQELLAEARDTYLKPIRQATRDRAVSMVANQNASIAADDVSKMELTHVRIRENLKSVYSAPPTYNFESPKLTLKQRVTNYIINFVKDAGFDI